MKSIKTVLVDKLTNGNVIVNREDKIIEESPLQIIIAYNKNGERKREVLLVTMRTPGDDFNMVAGFLFCEGIIQKFKDILSMKYIGNAEKAQQENVMLVELASHVSFNFEEKKRHFLSTSACGFCGRLNDILSEGIVFIPGSNDIKVHASMLYALPSLLKSSQGLFSETGGAHAVALINAKGELLHVSEDAGRHNAMDKLVGTMLKRDALPLKNQMIVFSGRLSYELIQKSLMAGISFICSIGAPTSLALELAEDYGITVIGFLKKESLNIYCGAERIIHE